MYKYEFLYMSLDAYNYIRHLLEGSDETYCYNLSFSETKLLATRREGGGGGGDGILTTTIQCKSSDFLVSNSVCKLLLLLSLNVATYRIRQTHRRKLQRFLTQKNVV